MRPLAGFLDQEKGGRPGQKENDLCQTQKCRAPVICCNQGGDNQGHKSTANSDTGIGAAQGQAQFTHEPLTYSLQIAQRPQADAQPGNQSPDGVLDRQVVWQPVEGSQGGCKQGDRGEYHITGAEAVNQKTLQGRNQHHHVGHDGSRQGHLYAGPAELLLNGG